MSLVRSIFKPGLFANKVAIVTGGGSGIGEGIATELSHLGCSVLICSRKPERLSTAVERIIKSSGCPRERVSFLKCNIRNEEEVQNMMKECVRRYGALNFLVNNGGGQYVSHAEDIKLKGWNAVIETNLTGTFLCIREAFREWMEKNGGSIVNITVEHRNGFPLMSHTGASRAGVENLTRSLALEWVSYGIRVNCVAPGNAVYSETAMKNYGAAGDEMFDVARRVNPMRRFGSVEEIAAATCYLLSPAAAWVNGVTLQVDGGGHLAGPVFFPIPDHSAIPPFKWDA